MIKILITCLFFAPVVRAQTIYTPVADGDVYSVGAVDETGVLVPGPTIHAIIMFSAFSATPDHQYSLVVNQYALPIGGDHVGVYGFASPDGVIRGSDFNSGTLLGTLVLPHNITFGQSVSLDVSSFVLTSPGPYWAFNLRDTAGNAFSSLEQNYGTPPELIATLVPEPFALGLLPFAAACFIRVLRLKRNVTT